ncbi:hypothetical protein ACIU1J_07670 [Azospirillum doebereinerae]|uniref:hypothetical protein n=1 Tax=Azospirillum doebereinerae TaxID=92933 RepID=UPI00384D9B70
MVIPPERGGAHPGVGNVARYLDLDAAVVALGLIGGEIALHALRLGQRHLDDAGVLDGDAHAAGAARRLEPFRRPAPHRLGGRNGGTVLDMGPAQRTVGVHHVDAAGVQHDRAEIGKVDGPGGRARRRALAGGQGEDGQTGGENETAGRHENSVARNGDAER